MAEVKKVLLVDDEDDIRTVAEMSLSAVGGFDVVLADSGPKGIELAASELPDVILLDVMMPGMDGPTTLSQLRAQESTREIPVIFMTAKIQAHERAQYVELGAIGVIPKPFDPMTLPDEVRRIVAER